MESNIKYLSLKKTIRRCGNCYYVFEILLKQKSCPKCGSHKYSSLVGISYKYQLGMLKYQFEYIEK
jgi:anaerobic ribonucleoside-triphosphate reductase